MSKTSWVCSIDGCNPATSFCPCITPESFLCETHMSDHIQKKDFLHKPLPIIALNYYKTPGYRTRLKRRMNVKSDAINAALRNIAAIDQCLKEVNARFEKLIWNLTEEFTKAVNNLFTIKAALQAEIEEGISEAERSLYIDPAQLSSPIAREIRNFDPERSDFTLFSFEIKEIRVEIEDFLKYEALPLSTEEREEAEDVLFVPQIHDNELACFNVESRETVVSKLDKTFSKQTVFCMADEENVLCVGGWPPTSAVFLLNLFTRQLSPQRPTITPRSSPGILRCGVFLYLFGGQRTEILAMKASEKLALEPRVWIGLADMHHPRSGFSPCKHERRIYLADVFQPHHVLEAFDITTERYDLLEVSLPPTLDNTSVAFVYDGELVIVTCDKQVGRLRLGDETSFRVKTINMRIPTNGQSSVPPLVLKGIVLWVDWYTGRLVAFDPESLAVRESPPGQAQP